MFLGLSFSIPLSFNSFISILPPLYYPFSRILQIPFFLDKDEFFAITAYSTDNCCCILVSVLAIYLVMSIYTSELNFFAPFELYIINIFQFLLFLLFQYHENRFSSFFLFHSFFCFLLFKMLYRDKILKKRKQMKICFRGHFFVSLLVFHCIF